MLDWIGGYGTIFDLAMWLFGIVSLLVVKRFFNPHRSWYYFMASFICLFAFHLVLGLYTGTLLSIPYTVGVVIAALLLCGSLAFSSLAFASVWRDKRRGVLGRIE